MGEYMLELNNSETKVLEALLKNNVLYSIKDLATETKLSNRAIYYNVANLSKKLMVNNIEPPRNIRGRGYYLPEESKRLLKNNYYSDKLLILDAHSRRIFLIFLMLTESSFNTLAKMAEILEVSRNTIVHDQKIITVFLKKYHLTVVGNRKGHFISGNEVDIRYFLQNNSVKIATVLAEVSKQKGDFDEIRSIMNLRSVIESWLESIEQRSFLNFTDDGKKHLENFYMLVLNRILRGHILQSGEMFTSGMDYHHLRKQNEFMMAKELLTKLGLDLRAKYEEEVYFLESMLLGTPKNEIGFSGESDVKNTLKKVTKEIVDNFKKLSGMNSNNESQLLNDLYTHLVSTFYRVKYNHQYRDGLVTQIKSKYFNVYTYTKMSLQPFEKLNVGHLNENEISLIAIYFGSQMVRQAKQGTVLLVCSAGLGTSRLLKEEILAHFPDVNVIGPITKSEYNNIQTDDYPLIITTTPLNSQPSNKVILLSPILTQRDLILLQKLFVERGILQTNPKFNESKFAALMDVINDTAIIRDPVKLSEGIKEILATDTEKRQKIIKNTYPKLSELITKDTTSFVDGQDLNWQAAIELAAKPLSKNNQISHTYVEAMINNVIQNGPYINIGRMVAFAHAKTEDGVNSLGMSLLHLKEPISLVDKQHPIKLVFVLAAVDQESHVNAMAELAALLRDEEKLDRLLDAKNFEEIAQIIRSVENS